MLVIVGLVLSPWAESRVGGIPFLACAAVLWLRRQRARARNNQIPDIFGLKGFQKEPVGFASIDSLKARPSRRITLDQLLGYYAQEEFKGQRGTLAELLRCAAERLGPPKPESDLGDPEFMVVHALN